jgi:hypothetical protein
MTLGGAGTAAKAAASTDDTALACCCWRHWGCGYGWGGGYGGGYAGWGGGWGGGYANTAWAAGYRPFLRPYATHYAVSRGLRGGFAYIGGTTSDINAPVVSLNLSVAKNPLAMQALTTDNAAQPQPGNGFRYDGGPINPIPLPRPDASPTTQAQTPATGLPVSLQKTKPASPYTYKAYGEK